MKEKLNRRDFLKISSTTAIALSAFPWLGAFRNDSHGQGASDRVRLGFIGVGSRGRLLLLSTLALPQELNFDVVAVCDNYEPHYQAAIQLSQNPQVKAFYDYREMLEMNDLDAVIIATPLHEHARISIDAMTAGKHVFCEKAMARHLPDIKQMYETSIKQNKILQIGHQRMFAPKYLKAIQMIRTGQIGKIGQIRAFWHRNGNWRQPIPPDHPELERKLNWRLYREYSAGLITELASHQIQVANWALDKVPVSVCGTGSIVYWNDGREVFDNIALIFSYDNGVQFIWDSMTSNRKYGCEEQIMGNIATMELESNKIFLEEPPPAPGIRQLIHSIEKGIFETVPIGGATWVPERPIRYEGEYISDKFNQEGTELELEAFIQFVRKGKAPENLLKEAYNASIWCILAEDAVYSGEKLTMPKEYII
ncbi:MAG: Gfo/Idh/MocA family oxidoreductase [candidate division KSB1 bacterium]|nr:Gfo/Idh/MocA family oxidoreductase [candidate division KSB1 bacterium]